MSLQELIIQTKLGDSRYFWTHRGTIQFKLQSASLTGGSNSNNSPGDAFACLCRDGQQSLNGFSVADRSNGGECDLLSIYCTG